MAEGISDLELFGLIFFSLSLFNRTVLASVWVSVCEELRVTMIVPPYILDFLC